MTLLISVPASITYFCIVNFFPSVGFHKWKSSILLENPVIKNKNNLTIEITRSTLEHKVSSAQLLNFPFITVTLNLTKSLSL